MQQHMVIKAMLGGLLDTLGQILLVYAVVPLMAGQALELAALRSLPCALSLMIWRSVTGFQGVSFLVEAPRAHCVSHRARHRSRVPCWRTMPSFSILEANVVRFMPKRAAAPFGEAE